MLKKLREMVWIALLPGILLCMLPSCGGGGGGEADQGIRPSSLHGVTLNFGGAQLTFTSGAPNTSGTGIEVGGVFYEQLTDTSVPFVPEDDTILDGPEFSWPVDIQNPTYEYRPVDGSSGLLTITGGNVEGGTLVQTGETNSIVLNFIASGEVITGITILYKINSIPTYVSDKFTVTGQIGGLGDSPQPIPVSYNGVNNGPGFLADPSFVGQLLTLIEDSGDTKITMSSFVRTGGSSGSNSRTERGRVAILFSIGPPGGSTETLFEADYTLTQPFGTENVIMAIDYTGGFSGDPLPLDDNIILTFTGGGILSGTEARLLNGDYTRIGGSGTFILSDQP